MKKAIPLLTALLLVAACGGRTEEAEAGEGMMADSAAMEQPSAGSEMMGDSSGMMQDSAGMMHDSSGMGSMMADTTDAGGTM